jgi:hypothetical protein
MNRLTNLIVFLAIAAGGCGGGGSGDSGPSVWFAVHQGPRSLVVSERTSYQFLVDPDPGSPGSCYEPPDAFGGFLPECPDSGVDSGGKPGVLKRGQLDEATVSALRGYFTDEKIRRYVEGAASYTEDCVQHGLAINWGRPAGQGGCWYPVEVSDPATSEMLQYVGNLFESIANG